MELSKVYVAARYNSGLNLRAIDALKFARVVVESGVNYANRGRTFIDTQTGSRFSAKPTEYKRCSSWNPVFTPEGSRRKLRFLENAESDHLTGLRFVAEAHELCSNLPLGWYCDNFQQETFRPAVWRLPGRNGETFLLSGYLEPWNNGAVIDVTSYYAATGDNSTDAERAAARDADSLAEFMAESQREHETKAAAENRIEECRDEIAEARAEHSSIVAELQHMDRGTIDAPHTCAAVRSQLASLRNTVRELRDEIKRLSDEPWTINPV